MDDNFKIIGSGGGSFSARVGASPCDAEELPGAGEHFYSRGMEIGRHKPNLNVRTGADPSSPPLSFDIPAAHAAPAQPGSAV
jgi:hypothetical protein